MVWRTWAAGAGEGTGTDGRMAGPDWNEAGKFLIDWIDVALATAAITLPGDGKYRVTYTGASTLDDINGTSEGDVVIVRADTAGAGGSLTIRNNGGGAGNIRTNAGVDIVLATPEEWAMFIHIGSVLAGGQMYGPA